MSTTYKTISESVYKILFITLFFVCIPFSLLSQEYYFDNYSVADGLSSSKVYGILQDKRDYLWLGTPAGVSKFDGIKFENFSPENGLSTGGVKSIFQDLYGNVWFGHLDGGVTIYNGLLFKKVLFDNLKINGDVTSIRCAGDSSLWISTVGSGIVKVKYNPVTGEILSAKQYQGSKGISDRVFYTLKSHDGSFYCVAPEGIYKYNEDNDRFTAALFAGLTTYFAKTTMFEDSKGNMWFGTYNGGVYKYDVQKDTMIIFDKRTGLAGNFISYITEDSKSDIWIGTIKYHQGESGLTRISPNGVIKSYTVHNGMPDDEILFLLEDKESNLLIGTRNKGLCIFKGEQFVNIIKSKGFNNPKTNVIYQHLHNEFWFGTDNGIILYHPDKKEDQRFTCLHCNDELSPKKIRFIKEDKRGIIWIGTEESGIWEYRTDEKRFVYDTYLNKNLPPNGMIKAFEIDDSNNLWIGTSDGVAFWNPNKKEGLRLTQGNGIAGNFISSLFLDKKNTLWIGTEQIGKGLTRYDISKNEFKIINVGAEITPTTITEDNKGDIWFGTAGRGVFAIKNDSAYRHITEKTGLLSNVISLLVVDDDNTIYIGTNKGLNLYHNNKIDFYTKRNGFIGIETQNNAVLIDDTKKLWFGTVIGVTIMNKQHVRFNNIEPLTHIKSMMVNYKTRLMKQQMELSHKENSIVFDYYSICFTNPNAVRYQVMLEGADDLWQPVTEQTMAIYSGLPPNNYTFRVKSCNSYGEWNKKPVSFSFIIEPPFYKRLWFILSVIVFIIVVIYFYIIYREKTLKRENRLLEDKVATRTAEVVSKSKELEQKNQDITASIRYAKRIQNAILPPEELISDSFILYKPKDIVSGDFYWFHTQGSKKYITVVDCTGHGVPGAFMSIIGHNSLNKIVKENGHTKPADILDRLNEEVVNTLMNQPDEDVKDGMDMSMIVYDKSSGILEFAGANNPMYLIRDGELIETKADRFAIGKTSFESGQRFTNHSIDILPDDIIYIFSDGYTDQFGGSRGKKFKIRPFKELLINIYKLPLKEQKKHLDNTIVEWMSEEEQIDDILIIGVKF